MLITAFTSIAENVRANRIVSGGHFTSPAGNPDLPPARELAYRVRLLHAALDALAADIAGPTVFNVDQGRDA